MSIKFKTTKVQKKKALCIVLFIILSFLFSLRCMALDSISYVGSLSTGVEVASGIDIVGHYAYVVDNKSGDNKGLRVVDITYPENPILVGSLSFGAISICKVKVKGNYAYVVSYLSDSYGLYVVDISDPELPVLVSSVLENRGCRAIAVKDNNVYLGCGRDLAIFDVLNPAEPLLVGSLYVPYYCGWGLDVDGDHVYYGGLVIIDVSNTTNPIVVSYLDLDDPRGTSVSDGYAYVASGSTGLGIVNVSNPAQPALVTNFLDSDSGMYHVEEVKKVGDYVYVAGYGLANKINVVNPEKPFSECCENSWYWPSSDLALTIDNHVAVAAGSEGLYIVEIDTLPPTVSDVSKIEEEDAILAFNAADFISHFNDPNGDSLTKIQVVSLPSNGVLKLSEMLVAIDQEIVVEDLENLSFTPDSNWNGVTSFAWKGYDRKYSSNIAQVSITINSINDTPIVSSMLKIGMEDTPIVFSALDFTNHFEDIDGNNLTNILIVSLPLYGELKLLGVPVVVNQEIVVEDLGGLAFTPNGNWYGTTSFDWRGYDGTAYSINTARVDITVNAKDDAPVVSGLLKVGEEEGLVTFSVSDFTEQFMDVEGNGLKKIQIMSLPEHGLLKISGVVVTQYQEIPVEDLADLTFEPKINWYGTTVFSWKGSDGHLYSNRTADIHINIIKLVSSGASSLKPLRFLWFFLSEPKK